MDAKKITTNCGGFGACLILGTLAIGFISCFVGFIVLMCTCFIG